MKKYFSLLPGLLFFISLYSQGDGEYKEPSRVSKEYHEYRLYHSTPPYGLAKVRSLMQKMETKTDPGNEDESTEALTSKVFNSLTLREKFTYTMIHGEHYSQICDADLAIENEEKKIFANLSDILGEGAWSDRQIDFLKNNRDSVMALIKESATRSKRLGLNYKTAILEINAKEMIPFLVSFYNEKKKDGDILTLLNLLMKENKYAPFLASATYKKLYADGIYYSTLDYSKSNEELIIKRAMDFYNKK